MPRHRGPFFLLASVFAAAALAGCGGDDTGDDGDITTLHVVEHAETNTVQHIGPADEKDSVGDVLGYANPVFDEANEERIGSDNGYCIRTVTGASGAWECAWTTTLEDGQLMVAGPFLDGRDSVNTITGGTGVYAGATGEMELSYRDPKGTEYDFIFHIEDAGEDGD
jgi:hypothetical protein